MESQPPSSTEREPTEGGFRLAQKERRGKKAALEKGISLLSQREKEGEGGGSGPQGGGGKGITKSRNVEEGHHEGEEKNSDYTALREIRDRRKKKQDRGKIGKKGLDQGRKRAGTKEPMTKRKNRIELCQKGGQTKNKPLYKGKEKKEKNRTS